jgi:acetylornithine deacetylase/succinyl-diaminopimelate desuccinylase-like protein
MSAHEAVSLLSRYIRINTSNPPGNESAAAEFFSEIFTREGIEYKTYESAPGRTSIRAVLHGNKNKGAIILLNHMDVVSANPDNWSFDPFSGEVRNGFVCGRGALDMKGLGIMELMAFLAMKRDGMELDRDAIFLAAADEEDVGEHGVRYLLQRHPEDFIADLVINEGGVGFTNSLDTRPLMMIATAEKGPCWLTLTRSGTPGRGSMPGRDNTLEKMIEALSRLARDPQDVTITPLMAEHYRMLASDLAIMKPFAEDGDTGTLIRILKDSGIMNLPHVAAMVKNTISITTLASGHKINVIPDLARAEVDIRLLPGQSVEKMIDHVRKVLADEAVEIDRSRAFGPSESPQDNLYFGIIRDVLQGAFPDAIVAPVMMTGTSDSRFFREKGIPSYGVMPVLIPMEHLAMVHGVDEMISVENLIRGAEVMTALVKRLCSGKK